MNVNGPLDTAFLESLSADPSTDVLTGRFFFNTTDLMTKWHNGSEWKTAVDTDTVQKVTNKDIDGGTASDTSRITLPKDDKTNLLTLARKAGTIVYAEDTQELLLDTGAALENISQLSSVPVGTLLPYAGATVPAGFLLCDGSTVSQTTYSGLYAVLGTTYGSDAGGNFTLPDLRSRFMRGVDAADSLGVGVKTLGQTESDKTSKNGLSLGSPTSASSTHRHNFAHVHMFGTVDSSGNIDFVSNGGHKDLSSFSSGTEVFDINNNNTIGGGGAYYTGGTGIVNDDFYTVGVHSPPNGGGGNDANTDGPSSTNTVTLGNGDTETSPHSIAVNYMIKT